jgi:hypothetical protein
MRRQRLDSVLLGKLKDKTGKELQYLREQVAKKASKLGISSEAYLVVWAKKFGIGTTNYQRTLDSSIQTEIREALATIFATKTKPSSNTSVETKKSPQRSPVSSDIEYMISDKELLDRCKDLLKARGKFDRVFREATTVLEDRIKGLSGLKGLKTAALVGKAINPDPKLAILKVSDESYEQEGFFSICKGLMLSFRDTTHHELTDKFQRADALKFCGFVDSILAILSKAKK